MNAVQVSQKLEEEYGMENVHRTSIYDDVRLLQSCGYPIKQAENSHKGWYMEKHLLEDWEIKLMLWDRYINMVDIILSVQEKL